MIFLHALNIVKHIYLHHWKVTPYLFVSDSMFFSNRKVRGPLNFDDVDVGLVSDSMVSNSLYLQNGSCASSSGAPFKSEQPDS